MRRVGVVLGAVLVAALAARAAERPRFENARIETRSAAGGLAAQVRALSSEAGPLWIGYAVPAQPGEYSSCCFDSRRGGGCCPLEKAPTSITTSDREGSTRLEGPQRLLVLLRVERGEVGKIRSFTDDCLLDAGGLRLVWLEDVRPTESVALLLGYTDKAREDSERSVGGPALAAIAMHGDPSADAALERMAAPARPEWMRKKAAFWLGSERGRRGYEILKRMLNTDPSEDVQEKVVFALSVSPEPEAVDTLIQVARSHRSTDVRGKAIFWLGQKAGKKAVAAITQAVEEDPELEIKKRAVFALSQLPPDEGVPLLIRVARTHPQPEVRKKAMFWLGQSKDARALAFFEEVLKR